MINYNELESWLRNKNRAFTEQSMEACADAIADLQKQRDDWEETARIRQEHLELTIKQLAEANDEILEQSRINGIGAQRECKLRGKLEGTERLLLESRANDRFAMSQLAAALAACKAKDEALNKIHGVAAPYDDGVKFGYIKDLTVEALAIQPDDSALQAYRDSVIEECAAICDEHADYPVYCGEAIRSLKHEKA